MGIQHHLGNQLPVRLCHCKAGGRERRRTDKERGRGQGEKRGEIGGGLDRREVRGNKGRKEGDEGKKV